MTTSIPSRSLPDAACHSYLGDSSQELYTRNFLQSNRIYQLLILPLPDIVVFPGETVPLRLQNREFIHKLQEILHSIEETKSLDVSLSSAEEMACHIGILRMNRTSRYNLEKIGTTVEIRSTHNQTTLDDEELIVTAKGRHRFELLQIQRLPPSPITQQPSTVLMGQVRILQDELMLPNLQLRTPLNPFPIACYQHISPLRLAKHAYQLFETLIHDNSQQYEVSLLKRWGCIESKGKFGVELDPVGFSFSLCANLPIPSSDLQILLNARDIIDRLRLIINYIERSQQSLTKVACLVCNQPIANKGDLFNVPGAEGCAGAYVNSYGAVHQTMTFQRLESNARIELTGEPSTQDSWFPGYAWTIIHCQRCYNHLGWRFTIANDSQSSSHVRGRRRGRRRRSSNQQHQRDSPTQRRRFETQDGNTEQNNAFAANTILGRLLRHYLGQGTIDPPNIARRNEANDGEIRDELLPSDQRREDLDNIEMQDQQLEMDLYQLIEANAIEVELGSEGEDDDDDDDDDEEDSYITAADEIASPQHIQAYMDEGGEEEEDYTAEVEDESLHSEDHAISIPRMEEPIRQVVRQFWGLRRSALRETVIR